MPWECFTFSATRICSSRLALLGRARPTVGTPGAQGELQAAVVAISGRDTPVAAGLAGRDGIPVRAVRIGGARRQSNRRDQRRHSERACEGRQTNRLADVLQLRSFRHARATDTHARTRGRDACTQAEEVEPHRLGQVQQREAGNASPGDRPGGRGKGTPSLAPSTAPLTRRFVVFELFAPFGVIGPYKTDRQSHIGEERVAFRSRTDHGRNHEVSAQVIRSFDHTAESVAPARRCEPYHHVFVTWATRDIPILPMHTEKRRASCRSRR